MANNRMSRVNSEIQKAVSSIIAKFDDLDISTALVTITKVDTFADFSLSKIYISVFGGTEKKQLVVKKLNDNKKMVRYELAHALRLRTVPELMFIVDDLDEKAERVMKLFKEIEGDNSDAE